MGFLKFVLGDQLSLDIATLADLEPARDIVLMMEVMEENTYVRHHKQKIVMVLSAMRHFAQAWSTRCDGRLCKLDAPDKAAIDDRNSTCRGPPRARGWL